MTSYSTQKTGIPPPPSPSPYSRLPTPAGRPTATRSISTSAYHASLISPSRPSLSHQSSSYDSFGSQAYPSPSPSKLPGAGGFGLQRPGSTVDPSASSHKRRGSVAEKAQLYEKLDDSPFKAPGTPGTGLGLGGMSRTPSVRRGSRTGSRPSSFIDSGSDGDVFGSNQLLQENRKTDSPRRYTQTGAAPPLSDQLARTQQQEQQESQASPASMRRSLGLLGGSARQTQQQEQQQQDSRKNDSELMPPPPPSLIRQFSSSSSSSRQTPPELIPQLSVAQKPPSPPPQVPTPSPRKGTHIRAASHGVAPVSRPPPRATSTRPVDPRPTSTIGSKVAAPGRPSSTVHGVHSARPRASTHNASGGPEPRRMQTPANDLSLPKNSRQPVGRTIAPPRSTSTRPTEPIASSSSASLRRSVHAPPSVATAGTRNRAPSHTLAPPFTGSASGSNKGSDSEPSIRSESVASTTSTTSSVRSDITTKPKPHTIAAQSTPRAPPSPQRTVVPPSPRSPQRSPMKAASTHKRGKSITTKPSKPNFSTYKQDYPAGAPPLPKPSTASLMQSANTSTTAAQSTEALHAQTRFLQLSILHKESFRTTAALRRSAHDKLYKAFTETQDLDAAASKALAEEQRIVDLAALGVVMKRSGVVINSGHVGNWKDRLSSSPEEAISSLSEQLSKVLGWFAEADEVPEGGQQRGQQLQGQGGYDGEYVRMVKDFQAWVDLPDMHDRKFEGMGVEWARDVMRVRRKMEMSLRALEGWVTLVVDREEGAEQETVLKSSLCRVLVVAVKRLKMALEELTAMQGLERSVVSTMRKELKRRLTELVEVRKETDLVEQKKELAAWEPAWA